MFLFLFIIADVITVVFILALSLLASTSGAVGSLSPETALSVAVSVESSVPVELESEDCAPL